MYGNRPRMQPLGFGGASGPPPRDLLILIGVLFVTFSLQFFTATRFIGELFHLSRAVWEHGFLWQLATYAFVAKPAEPIWFLLTLLVTFFFGRDVYRHLGRRRFWQLMIWAVGLASLVAVVVQILVEGVGLMHPDPFTGPWPFVLMQGQNMVLTVLIAAFATVYADATILVFFVLPIKARWFLGIQIFIAFANFLTTHDLAGFLAICTATGFVYLTLTGGGLWRVLREWRLRIERLVLETRLRRMKDRRGLRIVKPPEDDEPPRGPWVH